MGSPAADMCWIVCMNGLICVVVHKSSAQHRVYSSAETGKEGLVSSTTSIVSTYSVKSDFPKTKSLNLYLLVSLPASLPRTDYAKLPCLPRGKRPALAFFSPGLYRWIARSSKKPKPRLVLLRRRSFHELCTSCHRHVGHIATGLTCQAPNNSVEQQGGHTPLVPTQ